MKLPNMKLKLFTQMVLHISIVICVTSILAALFFTKIIDDLSTEYLGKEAMSVAQLAANDKRIIHAFDSTNPSKEIQPIAEKMRKLTGASYIVIGNKQGIRYSHPNPKYIGKPMGTTNDPVFKQHTSVVYFGEGISGPAIKAKTPILNEKGDIIGVSSVGFLMVDVKKRILTYKEEIIALAFLLLLIGIISSFFIARRIKRKMFGLEPEEISYVFKEKEAILESIRDGIIAVDKDFRVLSMNKRARELLVQNLQLDDSFIQNHRLRELIQEVIFSKKEKSNQKVFIVDQLYVIDLSLVKQMDRIDGVVLTIRTEFEIEQLFNEVSKIKSYSENIRALNHEFLNKLNTIYGLLCIEEYDKARELISSEVTERQSTIVFLMTAVKEPLLVACLLGKINRSKELKVNLKIDQESCLDEIPDSIDTHLLVTILGNIIDNAMEAAKEKNNASAAVTVSFTDIGRDIVFDIQDNGTGILAKEQDDIFTEGYTTKPGNNRGIGLSIVKNSLQKLNGQVYIINSLLGGAKFTLVIPKR
ncbi:ATP-binding protein [Neobacillus cucumis]|uniref:ATP-binding protein n=1 Tax=Neobacillus cucumis TaxID=1740721 RepID=UPI001964C6B4|nr:sensor histidine kinase [Neobacillus cucumis]MBM7652137.1 two-component system CitB family sensor kinase [Neobacillus cucumis]